MLKKKQTIKTLHLGDSLMRVCGFAEDAYFLNAQDHLTESRLLSAVLIHHVSAGATLIDVGANCGIITALMNALVSDATIISVEPGGVFECLRSTVEANAMRKQRSFNCCAGKEDGMVGFVDADDTSASHIGSPDLPQISVRSLDSIVTEQGIQRCDFVKIDVEGYEADALDGMRQINHDFQPLIFMEFNPYAIAARQPYSPRILLERVVETFGCFLALTSPGDTALTQHGPRDVIPFLHRNMTSRGCVEDIIFSANSDRIAAFNLA